MKDFLLVLAAFVSSFSFIQFLAGAVGCKTILSYGHADACSLFLSVLVGMICSLITAATIDIRNT